jgi:D-alanine-D-alanine ligase
MPLDDRGLKPRVGLVFNDPFFSGMGIYRGAEEDVLREVEAINEALKGLGHEVERLPVTDDFSSFFNEISSKYVDVVFNLCERVWDDAWGEVLMAHVLERLGISFTGSDSRALWLGLHKDKSKTVLSLFGIRTPPFKMFAMGKEDVDDLKFPLIVKPNLEDGSLGIDSKSVVSDVKSLRKKVKATINEFRRPVIVEEYIDGREFNVSILGDRVLAVGEVEFFGFHQGKPRVVCYKAKWDKESDEYKGTVTVCPANLNKKTQNRIKDIAIKAYRAIGCRDYARVDMRMDSLGSIYIIEVNPNPDISPGSGFSMALKAAGLSYEAFVERVIGFAVERSRMRYDKNKNTGYGNTG